MDKYINISNSTEFSNKWINSFTILIAILAIIFAINRICRFYDIATYPLGIIAILSIYIYSCIYFTNEIR
jgi:hypothetical protein